MRELVFATVLAEIKNAFVDEINDPDLIQLLYGGVAYPLKITIGKVQKGAASKIMNREPGGRPLRVIKGHSQDEGVKKSIGQYFKQNVIKHFMPGINDLLGSRSYHAVPALHLGVSLRSFRSEKLRCLVRHKIYFCACSSILCSCFPFEQLFCLMPIWFVI